MIYIYIIAETIKLILFLITVFNFLADLDLLEKVEVEYVTLPGWKSSIEQIKSYDALPDNCKKYVEFIEESLKVPIKWIGVGPARESMVTKP